MVYTEIIESFDEFIKLIEDKDYDIESVSEFCSMEIHDDILDTIELVNDELKKYAVQMKERNQADEYIISYDRLKTS